MVMPSKGGRRGRSRDNRAIAPSPVHDIVIVGAGAAGLATAIFTKRLAPAIDVLLIDGARKPGAKILVSGGGRCNVLPSRLEPERDASRRGWELNLSTVYAHGVWRPTYGVQMIFVDTPGIFAPRRRLDETLAARKPVLTYSDAASAEAAE